jgi:hypothetical protein
MVITSSDVTQREPQQGLPKKDGKSKKKSKAKGKK